MSIGFVLEVIIDIFNDTYTCVKCSNFQFVWKLSAMSFNHPYICQLYSSPSYTYFSYQFIYHCIFVFLVLVQWRVWHVCGIIYPVPRS